MTESEWLSSTDPAAMLAWLTGSKPPPPGAYGESGHRVRGCTDRKLRLFACALIKDDGNWEAAGYPDNPLPWLSGWIAGIKYQEQAPVEYARAAGLLRCLFGNPFRLMNGICGRYWVNNGGEPMKHKDCRDCSPILSYRNGMIRTIAEGIYADCDFSPAAMDHLWDALEDAGCDNEEIRHHLMGEERCPNYHSPDWPTHQLKPCGTGTVETFCGTCNGTGWHPAATCPMCSGKGDVNTGPGDYGDEWISCSDCHSTGRIAGTHVRGCWVIDLILGKE